MRGHTKHSRRFGAAWSLVLPALLVLVAGPGCEWEDSIMLPENAPPTMPRSLNLNYRAINMAVGQQVQLSIDPRNLAGEPLSGLPAPVYTTSDPSLKVDETGKLTATMPATPIIVTVKMSSVEGNWTISETARVTVVAAPYEVSDFRMELNGPTLVPANRARRFDAVAVLSDGVSTASPMTFYEASVPPNIYTISNQWTGTGTTRGIGNVTVRGTSYIFGTVYRDSVSFQTTYPDSAALAIFRATNYMDPSPSTMTRTDHTILKGGKITFINQNPTMKSSVVFDDQANVIGGNIPVVPASPGHVVIFPNTGKFTYKTSFGAQGTVTVVDWPAQP